MSKIKRSIEGASHDMKNAELIGPLGSFLFHPLREAVLEPALDMVSHVVPPVAGIFPFGDEFCATVLNVYFGAVKFCFGMLPHCEDVEIQATQESVSGALRATARASMKTHDEIVPSLAKNSIQKWDPEFNRLDADLVKLVFTVLGLMANSLWDLILTHEEKFAEWTKMIKTLVGYLLYMGIDKELWNAFVGSRTLENIIIMSRIQQEFNSNPCTSRREKVIDKTRSKGEAKEFIMEGAHYLRYSAAIYGIFQIEASKLECVFNDAIQGEERPWWDLAGRLKDAIDAILGAIDDRIQEARRRQILNYLNLEEEDLLYLTPAGGDPKLVRHLVAVDRQKKAIVVAVRGTFSTSDIVIDLEAMTKDFCGGKGHRGMVESAEFLWKHKATQKAIQAGMQRHPNYRIVFTGHSLGGGIASLLQIQHHFQDDCPHPASCFVFGSPPAFAATSSKQGRNTKSVNVERVRRAIQQTTCFISGVDTVSFLSINSTRRLASTLEVLDTKTEKANPIELFQITRGLKRPPKEWGDIVDKSSSDLPTVEGGEVLQIAPKNILWIFNDEEQDTYTFEFCLPSALATLPLFVAPNIILDHLIPAYEDELRHLSAGA